MHHGSSDLGHRYSCGSSVCQDLRGCNYFSPYYIPAVNITKSLRFLQSTIILSSVTESVSCNGGADILRFKATQEARWSHLGSSGSRKGDSLPQQPVIQTILLFSWTCSFEIFGFKSTCSNSSSQGSFER